MRMIIIKLLGGEVPQETAASLGKSFIYCENCFIKHLSTTPLDVCSQIFIWHSSIEINGPILSYTS